MVFTVVWAPEADAQFVDLYLAAPDRNALTASNNRIESELRIDPETKGIAFSANYYGYYDDPLAVLYQVLPDDRMVRIIQVKRISDV